MKKEEILKMAQETKKDERSEMMSMKASRTAGNLSILFASVLAAVILFDKGVLNNNRTFDYLTVVCMLMGIGAMNNAIFSIYELFSMRKYSRIIDSLIFGALTIIAIIKTIIFFVG